MRNSTTFTGVPKQSPAPAQNERPDTDVKSDASILTAENPAITDKIIDLLKADNEQISKCQEITSKNQEIVSKNQELISGYQGIISENQRIVGTYQGIMSVNQGIIDKLLTIIEKQLTSG